MSVSLDLEPDPRFNDVSLVLVGGCRCEEDEKRVYELKKVAQDLDMADHVVFDVNVNKGLYSEVGSLRTFPALSFDCTRGTTYYVE